MMPFLRGIATYLHKRQGCREINVRHGRNGWGWPTFLIVSNLAVGLSFGPIVLARIVICFVWIFGKLIRETIV